MRSKYPQIPTARYRGGLFIRKRVFRTRLSRTFLGGIAQNAIDLTQRKSSKFQIVEVKVQQALQFDRQNIGIPTGILRCPWAAPCASIFGLKFASRLNSF